MTQSDDDRPDSQGDAAGSRHSDSGATPQKPAKNWRNAKATGAALGSAAVIAALLYAGKQAGKAKDRKAKDPQPKGASPNPVDDKFGPRETD